MTAALRIMTAPASDVDERLERAIVQTYGAEGERYVQHRRELAAMREDPTLDQDSVTRFAAAGQVRSDAAAKGETIDLVEALRRLERGA